MGKGSKRREEDAEAIRRNWPFDKPKEPEKESPRKRCPDPADLKR